MNAPLPTTLWVMSVPVISTAHLPAPNTLATWQGTPVALTPDGGFLYIPNGYDNDWLEPIKDWLLKHGYDWDSTSVWVRFDSDADVIEGLPTYPWATN